MLKLSIEVLSRCVRIELLVKHPATGSPPLTVRHQRNKIICLDPATDVCHFARYWDIGITLHLEHRRHYTVAVFG